MKLCKLVVFGVLLVLVCSLGAAQENDEEEVPEEENSMSIDVVGGPEAIEDEEETATTDEDAEVSEDPSDFEDESEGEEGTAALNFLGLGDKNTQASVFGASQSTSDALRSATETDKFLDIWDSFINACDLYVATKSEDWRVSPEGTMFKTNLENSKAAAISAGNSNDQTRGNLTNAASSLQSLLSTNNLLS